MESKMEWKIRKVCKTAKAYEDAAEKSMTVMTHIYNAKRRVVVNRYGKTHRLYLLGVLDKIKTALLNYFQLSNAIFCLQCRSWSL